MDSELQKHINAEVRKTLEDHAEHLKIANSEMGVIKTDINWLKQEFFTFSNILNKVDNRVWLILSSVVLGVMALAVQILLAIYKK